MPELPEVETVKRGLESLLDVSTEKIVKIKTGDKKLRDHPKLSDLNKVRGQRLVGIKRKAKYLLFELEDYYLLSHLGMTGSWRIEKDQRKHDHIQIYLSSKRVLTYHDPRRFGMFSVLRKTQLNTDKRFVHLGLDPVVDTKFTGDYLYTLTKKRSAPIKSVIMNQEIVVGVGNIYASEALYLAGINPLTPACKLSKRKVNLLSQAIREVLFDAIDCGGTTISDFKQAGGSSGYFQNLLMVYGRDKEACLFCDTRIKSQVIAGRNSYWCSRCQPR